jgi:hypothetical protein
MAAAALHGPGRQQGARPMASAHAEMAAVLATPAPVQHRFMSAVAPAFPTATTGVPGTAQQATVENTTCSPTEADFRLGVPVDWKHSVIHLPSDTIANLQTATVPPGLHYADSYDANLVKWQEFFTNALLWANRLFKCTTQGVPIWVVGTSAGHQLGPVLL